MPARTDEEKVAFKQLMHQTVQTLAKKVDARRETIADGVEVFILGSPGWALQTDASACWIQTLNGKWHRYGPNRDDPSGRIYHNLAKALRQQLTATTS